MDMIETFMQKCNPNRVTQKCIVVSHCQKLQSENLKYFCSFFKICSAFCVDVPLMFVDNGSFLFGL